MYLFFVSMYLINHLSTIYVSSTFISLNMLWSYEASHGSAREIYTETNIQKYSLLPSCFQFHFSIPFLYSLYEQPTLLSSNLIFLQFFCTNEYAHIDFSVTPLHLILLTISQKPMHTSHYFYFHRWRRGLNHLCKTIHLQRCNAGVHTQEVMTPKSTHSHLHQGCSSTQSVCGSNFSEFS